MTDVATLSPKTAARHKWDEPIRLQHKTMRTCTICGIVKVTRHEPGVLPWLEFWRGEQKIETDRTPACQ